MSEHPKEITESPKWITERIKWITEHPIFILVSFLVTATGIVVTAINVIYEPIRFDAPQTNPIPTQTNPIPQEEGILKNFNKSIVYAEALAKDYGMAIEKVNRIATAKDYAKKTNIDKSTTIINSAHPPIGRCGEGIANPQGWWGEIPKCGEEGKWLSDCDRKAYFKGFVPTIRTYPDIKKRMRECK